jgi:endonuclease YncB( thermonuclease family)
MATVLPFRLPRSVLPGGFPKLVALRARWAALAGARRRFGFHALTTAIGVAAFLFGPWSGERPSRASVVAPAAVIDGDSLRAGAVDIRLIGIDAPELRQTCHDRNGGEWPCGRVAKARLVSLVSRGDIACTAYGRDGYNRTLAVCSAGDITDLGEALVREGYAVDSGGITSRYTTAEAEARTQRRGIWRGFFERPERWRRLRRDQRSWRYRHSDE